MTQQGRKSKAALTIARIVPAKRPSPPASLNARGKELFNEMVSMHEPAFFVTSLHLLAAYCGAVARHENASRILEKEGLLIEGPSGLKQHPAISILNAAAQQMVSLGTKLRITNQARYRNDSAKLRAANTSPSANGKKPWEYGE